MDDSAASQAGFLCFTWDDPTGGELPHEILMLPSLSAVQICDLNGDAIKTFPAAKILQYGGNSFDDDRLDVFSFDVENVGTFSFECDQSYGTYSFLF